MTSLLTKFGIRQSGALSRAVTARRRFGETKGFKAAQDENDFQLGKLLIRAQDMLWQWLTMRFLRGNEVCKWLASDQPSGCLLTSRWRLTNFVTDSIHCRSNGNRTPVGRGRRLQT